MAFPDKKPKMAVMIGLGAKPDDEPDQDEGEFEAPEGLDLEGKKPGDTIEVVAVLEIKEDGKLCVRKVNGIDVPGYDDKDKTASDDEDQAPDKDSFTSAAMGGGEPSQEDT